MVSLFICVSLYKIEKKFLLKISSGQTKSGCNHPTNSTVVSRSLGASDEHLVTTLNYHNNWNHSSYIYNNNNNSNDKNNNNDKKNYNEHNTDFYWKQLDTL